MKTELDHIFLLVADRSTAERLMQTAGLVTNYSRQHPGQGTTNICACLDDMFVEFLWFDGSKISAESERIGLGDRGRGDGSPIGVSWRGAAPVACDAYSAPFLPAGVAIPVAQASLNRSLPFVFQTPGGVPPIDRTDGLPGERQRPRFGTLALCEISLPNPQEAASLLQWCERIELVKGQPGFRLVFVTPDGRSNQCTGFLSPI
ncbi:VOC family protein [Palleronia rufa]|uniref:VOC family protein n=1 Tax=Palleronia rufa TaxID=1530186 RepID=UPI0009DDCC42|nr:VOC family protein [Palleronia rufa]